MDDLFELEGAARDRVRVAAALRREVLAANASRVDVEARFPDEAIGAIGEAGLLGLTVPTALGGAGEGPRVFAAVAETLAGGCASTAMIYVMHVAATQALLAAPELRERDALLREVAAGRHLTTLAFSERGSRSHFWAPVSELSPAAGGGFVTDASKSWVTSARHAQSYVSSARAAGTAGAATLYLVRPRAAGVSVTGTFDGLGLRGNGSAGVRLQGYAVNAGDLVSAPGEGAKAMLEVVLPWFCIGSAAMATGLCLAAVEGVTRHLNEASFQHTGERLRDLAVLRARLAAMHVRTEMARGLLLRAVAALEHLSAVTGLHVLQARLAAVEAAVEVTDLAMKAGGGAAFSRQLPLERLFRDARAGWVMAPTVDHLQDFIGRALTGMPLL